MKTFKHRSLVVIATYTLALVFPLHAEVPPVAMTMQTQLNLMPVPASVQIQTGRLPITSNFNVAIKNFTDDRLRAGITRVLARLAGRTVLTLPPSLATDEGSATLVVQCERPGETVPSVNENESYSLEINDKQARLVAPTVVGALRGLETFLQLLQGDRDGYYLPAIEIRDQPRFPWRGLLIDVARHYENYYNLY